jgi:hypothetical protein
VDFLHQFCGQTVPKKDSRAVLAVVLPNVGWIMRPRPYFPAAYRPEKIRWI